MIADELMSRGEETEGSTVDDVDIAGRLDSIDDDIISVRLGSTDDDMYDILETI